jgi:hypothetical protein
VHGIFLSAQTGLLMFVLLKNAKLRVPKVAYFCFSMGQISPFYGVKQLKFEKGDIWAGVCTAQFSTPLL